LVYLASLPRIDEHVQHDYSFAVVVSHAALVALVLFEYSLVLLPLANQIHTIEILAMVRYFVEDAEYQSGSRHYQKSVDYGIHAGISSVVPNLSMTLSQIRAPRVYESIVGFE
jgi:hypothetical protein